MSAAPSQPQRGFTGLRLRSTLSPKSPRQITLRLSIGTLLSLLLTALGGVLILYNSQQQTALTLSAADDLFDRIGRQTLNRVTETFSPAFALVEQSARLLPVESPSVEDDFSFLDYFATSLRSNPQLESIYTGFADGSFFEVWALDDDPGERTPFRAPDDASYVVKTIDPTGPADVSRYHQRFYDAELDLIGSDDLFVSGYDPRERIWYQEAMANDGPVQTAPYAFFTKPELGTTVALRLPGGTGVMAVDLLLKDVSSTLGAEKMTPSSLIVVFDAEGTVIAYSDESRLVRASGVGHRASAKPVQMANFDHGVVESLFEAFTRGARSGDLRLDVAGATWLGAIYPLARENHRPFYVGVASPETELLAGLDRIRRNSVLLSVALVLLALAMGLVVSRRLSLPLQKLAEEARMIRELKLRQPIRVHSRISEVSDLVTSMGVMKAAIEQFVTMGRALSAERNVERLLERFVLEAMDATRADAGAIALVDREWSRLQIALLRNRRNGIAYGGPGKPSVPFPAVLLASEGEERPAPLEVVAARGGKTLVHDDLDSLSDAESATTRAYFEEAGFVCRSLLLIPLRNRRDEIIGVLQLARSDAESGTPVGFSRERVSYAAAFVSSAALVIDNQRLLQAQKDLFDALIEVLASAIDAKSPYTGGHCQRVPELARMLADAADESDDEAFADFTLDEDGRYQLFLAGWLHDCGKITTPEYVVDKATKLETIHNRIHEIRTRFEVLWRDAEIAYYAGLLHGGEEAELRAELEQKWQRIRDDFAFVAECNIGGETLDSERITRLEAIGAQTWQRHLDDRLGLSGDEIERVRRTPTDPLPATECLLADKPEHIVPRPGGSEPLGDNPYGFKMDVPEHEYNRGELYNLSVRRGTLTDEERFKINDHIIQTIVLLNKLPFPADLRDVPTWAGNHHEKLNGTGYPRRLSAAELSLPERIMAVADIFEALTAADRPYKRAKTLSESVRILALMRDDGHVCPDLFRLFLTSGVYRTYAERFLRPEQIDPVDIDGLLGQDG